MAYGRVAGQYVALFGSVERVHDDDLAFVRRHLGEVVGPVLDLGCGPGHLTGFLHGLGRDVTGIDLVPEFVEHARTAHPGVPFEVGSLTAVDRPPGSVTGALAWYSLIHLDPDALDDALTAVRRLMAPGGRLVVGFFDGDTHAPFAHRVATAYRWPADELARRLACAGFAEVDRLQRATHGERPHAALAVIADG